MVNDRSFDEYVLALSQDTLVARTNFGVSRSVDNGVTFQTVPSGTARINVPTQVPQGVPYAGSIIASAGNTAAFGAYSRDRGASWRAASIAAAPGQTGYMEDLAIVRRGPRASRVVAAGDWGLATSDDGGATYTPVPGRWQYFRFVSTAVAVLAGAAPGSGDRLLAFLYDPQHVPAIECLVVASDDGGDSWQELYDLRGDPNRESSAFVDFGGGRAVTLMGGGHVWQTGDGGASWVRTGQVPGAFADPLQTWSGRVSWGMRGADGRLYVGGSRLGNANPGWAFRTVDPLSFAVAGEAEPSEAPGRGVTVRPNPAGDRAEVVLSLAAAGPVRVVVVDALGREVATVLDGAAGVGERVIGVETASWPPGVYVVRATAGTQVTTARLVVSR